jgi:hypothetical protein
MADIIFWRLSVMKLDTFLTELRRKRDISVLLGEMCCAFNAPAGHIGWSILKKAGDCPEYHCHIVGISDMIDVLESLQKREYIFDEFCAAVPDYVNKFSTSIAEKVAYFDDEEPLIIP